MHAITIDEERDHELESGEGLTGNRGWMEEREGRNTVIKTQSQK